MSKYILNQLLSSDSNAKEIMNDMTNQNHYLLPRIHIGDIDSDGYPDILVTIRYNNGSSIPHILLNKEMPKNSGIKTGPEDSD